MFCPKCGGGDQSPESYCRKCGEWLPDLEARKRPGLFRGRTREQKIRKMRLLEIMSAALAFASAAIILSSPSGQGDKSLLHLAGLFCVGIAVYQVVIFYIGLTMQTKRAKDQIETASHMDRTTNDLPQSRKEIEEPEFLELPSITENTTELIRPNPREGHGTQHQ